MILLMTGSKLGNKHKGEEGMNINVQTKSGVPIYEQIERQIKDMILSGSLKEGELLPSIRALAADSRISVITVKRAYEDLEKEGMIYSVQGKGFYVDDPDLQYLQEKKTVSLEVKLSDWVNDAKAAGMSKEEALDMLGILWE
jgi:GntR family transcriptional regulator